jgi:predicted negative regulator of RcsB-dependent stress response
MARKKKVSRKQLLKEPDEFLTLSSRLFQYVLAHRYQLLALVGGVIGIVLIISGLQYYALKRSKEVFIVLENARLNYERILNEKGPREAYLAVEEEFEALIDDYSGKTGAKLARVFLANICYRGGNPQKAVDLFTEALDDFEDPFLQNMIISGLAYAYEATQNADAAAEYYERLAANARDTVLKDEALFHLGGIYAGRGNTQKSLAAYRGIVEGEKNSFYHDIAREKVKRLAPAADANTPQ